MKGNAVKPGPAIDLLHRKYREVYSSISIDWKRAPRAPRKPLSARPAKSWPAWNYSVLDLKKNTANWLYADVKIPRSHRGLDTRNTPVFLFMHGWCPFTMWIDGEEQFKEEHAWYASGPIADPVPLAPGRHRLVMCLEPTELPTCMCPMNVFIRPLTCARTAIQLSAAAAQLQLAATLARSAAQRKLVDRAARALDTDAIENEDWPRALKSVTRMERALEPLSARAKEITVRLLGHAHIDMDWMWTWKDTVHCARRDFKAVTDLMDDYPDLTFAISQVPTYDVVRRKDPSVFRKVKARVAEGRWEAVVGTWTEGDLHMADGESIARHMLYAKDWTRKHLDSETNVLWEPDTFGHPANMPQLAKLGEMDYYFHMRTNPGGRSNWPARVWKGIDGTGIETASMSYNGDLDPTAVVGKAISHLRFGLKNALHIWGIGNHGGAMSRYWLDLLALYRDKPLIPTIRFGTLSEHMKAIRRSGVKLPSNRGETFSMFEGCWTTHAQGKKYNRACEGALLTAETMSALTGLDHNDTLRGCWTKVLFNHFHDLMDGCSVNDSYVDACARFRQVLNGAGRVTAEAFGRCVKPARGGRKLAVLNQLGITYTGPVKVRLPASARYLVDEDGRPEPIQKMDGEFVFMAREIPAFSARTYSIRTSSRGMPAVPPVDVSEERSSYRVETMHAVSQLSTLSGVVGEYYDTVLGRKFVAHGLPKHMSHVNASRQDLGMNVFHVCDESPNDMSAWHINDIVRRETLLRGAKVTLVETGPVFARFRVVQRFRSSKIEEDVIYYNDLSRVDFEATIDWREKGGPDVGVPQLRVSFNGNHSRAVARFEGPFCITERPSDGQEQPTQKWVDNSGRESGFTVYNDSRHGCSVLGCCTRMTLLRNAYGPDEESDNGVHTVRFAFEPHGPRMPASELVRRGMIYNRAPLTAVTGSGRAGLPAGLQLDGSTSVICTCLRRAEHSNGLILRLWEADGRKARVRFRLGKGITSAREVNFLENPVRTRSPKGGAVSASFRPYEVKTFLLRTRK